MELSDLTPDQIEKAKACTSADELAELAKAEGIKLTDEQLEAASGASEWYCYCDGPTKYHCPTDDNLGR